MREGRRMKSNGLYPDLYSHFTSNVKLEFALTRRYLLSQLEMRISENSKKKKNSKNPKKLFCLRNR